MNFLLRPSQNAAAAVSPTSSGTPLSVMPPSGTPPSGTTPSGTPRSGTPPMSKAVPRALLLEGVVAADRPSIADYSSEDQSESFGNETDLGSTMSPTSFMQYAPFADKHIDVLDDEGSITIPSRQLPDDLSSASDMRWFRSFDRSFVFPGEQVYIVACLSGSHQDPEIITPFKVAAVMNKNENLTHQVRSSSSSETQQVKDNDNENETSKSGNNHKVDVSASESILRMANHKRHIQTLLQRFKDSHFFIRIAESTEVLWSKRSQRGAYEKRDNTKLGTPITAVVDSGSFDAHASGGVARDSIKCTSLANGDIVVVLQVNIGVDSLKDPVLEILQFEKHQERITALDTDVSSAQHSPCGELLKWLLPINNSHVSPISQPSPLVNASPKSNLSSTPTTSQRFSFGSFRSNSMSPVPPSLTPVVSSPVSPASNPNFDLDVWDNFASQKFVGKLKTGNQGLFSYRGISLEPERFSVCCGLQGIYIPGRRWRKRVQIISPVDIHTFDADCNTDDLLCVQIKNVSPTHIPDLVVYVDSITIILEEALKVGPPSSVPIACIEAGTDYSLPNLALRRGEEHSFILKPATSSLKSCTIQGDVINKSFQPNIYDGERNLSCNKYAVLVSCRCNYSDSRLFFKKPINWRPRLSRDLMISVASQISKQTLHLTGQVSQLLVQVLTLKASNLTSEDLNMTVVAPASFTTPPFVSSQNSPPSSPSLTQISGFATTQKLSSLAHFACNQNHNATVADLIPTTALNCTHLWLQSRLPLGCVPSQSTATIKLELLPLTDGIITLDTLQIYVKEKGKTYVPEYAPKINATSSIATGIK